MTILIDQIHGQLDWSNRCDSAMGCQRKERGQMAKTIFSISLVTFRVISMPLYKEYVVRILAHSMFFFAQTPFLL